MHNRIIYQIACVLVFAGIGSLSAQTVSVGVPMGTTEDQKAFRALYQELVEIDTTDSVGSCTVAAEAMAVWLRKGGIPAKDIQVIPHPEKPQKGNLVARYRGTGLKKPVMLLGHLDVVEAKRSDWKRDPFKLIEENGYFYARGSFDDKAMVAAFISNLIRYKKQGYVPDRDLILVATCDEEIIPSAYNGLEYLLKDHLPLIESAFAINEGARGLINKAGKYVSMEIMAGEKISHMFLLETTSAGGHSARPTKDNAIYHLSEGLSKLSKLEFPFTLTDTTRAYFQKMAKMETGQTSQDMLAITAEPPDAQAIARLSTKPLFNAMFRTTCVATKVDAGHATNALPQSGQAHVNCRILPGDSADAVAQAIERIVANPKVKITSVHQQISAASPPLTDEIMKPMEQVTAEMFPGIPVIPVMNVAATDGRLTINAGIPTYGITGMFRDEDGSGVHGLDERIRVTSLYEGHEFLYRLVRLYGGGKDDAALKVATTGDDSSVCLWTRFTRWLASGN